MYDELMKYEQGFNPDMFLTKVNNIFVLMMNGIMFQNLQSVTSWLNDNVRQKLLTMINDLKHNDLIQMYDELNVKNTYVRKVEILDDRYRIEVEIEARYLDYRLNNTTKQIVSGNNESRVLTINNLVFELKKDHKDLGMVMHCPNCGANIDYNATGYCSFCNQQLPKEDYDWILVDWNEVKR